MRVDLGWAREIADAFGLAALAAKPLKSGSFLRSNDPGCDGANCDARGSHLRFAPSVALKSECRGIPEVIACDASEGRRTRQIAGLIAPDAGPHFRRCPEGARPADHDTVSAGQSGMILLTGICSQIDGSVADDLPRVGLHAYLPVRFKGRSTAVCAACPVLSGDIASTKV